MTWKCESCGSTTVGLGAKVDVFVQVAAEARRIVKVLVCDEGGLDYTDYRECAGCGGQVVADQAVAAAEAVVDADETDWPAWTVGNH